MTDWESRMSERARTRSAASAAVAWAEAELQNVVENDPPEPSEAEILLNLPPRQDAEHCGHGLRIGGEPGPAIAYACPLGKCLCCEDWYPWIASFVSISGGSGGTSSESHQPDQHLCPECGGITRHERHGVPIMREMTI